MKNICNSVLVLLLINFSTMAQLGPISPCVDCEVLVKRTEPFNGMWYNPDQSGTGFAIDVQKGKLFGAYFGYDDEGKQLWLTFIGDLVPSSEVNIMWTLDVDLTRFENGNSFNNAYNPPDQVGYLGKISIKFTQKNHATFSVNNGEEQNIVPITFGVSATADFQEQTSYKFPDLEGVWTFVYHFKSSNASPFVPVEPFSIVSQTLTIPKKSYGFHNNDEIEDVIYHLYAFDDYPNAHPVGTIVCSISKIDDVTTGPSCEFIDDRGLLGDVSNKPHYKMKLGGLGAFRLFGEHEDGHTFEAIKVNSKHYNFFE